MRANPLRGCIEREDIVDWLRRQLSDLAALDG